MKRERFVSRIVSLIVLMSVFGMGNMFAQKTPKESPASDFKYDLNETGDGVVIQEYLGKGGDVVIPSKIEDIPVVGLKLEIFHGFNFKPITSLIFPDSVIFIDSQNQNLANNKLKKLVLPKNLKIINRGLFVSAVNLTELILPENLEEIGEMAFAELGAKTEPGIKSIVFPKTLKKIGAHAFDSANIQSIIIPESVEYIDDGAFRGCENLVSVTMPEKQIEYGYNDAFSYCPKLTLKERKKIKDTGYSGGF